MIMSKTIFFKKCSKRQLGRKKCNEEGFLIKDYEDYELLKSILRKSIEWSEIAKANEVERISKEIELNGKDVWSPFGGGKVQFLHPGLQGKQI